MVVIGYSDKIQVKDSTGVQTEFKVWVVVWCPTGAHISLVSDGGYLRTK